MSTSFWVYPCNNYIPKIGEVIENTNVTIEKFIKRYSIPDKYKVNMGFNGQEGCKEIDNDFLLNWDTSGYIYLAYPEMFGSCFINYYCKDIFRFWATDAKTKSMTEVFDRCLNYNRYWHVDGRDFTKGFVAGSIAMLTDGFVYSDDGAWDFKQMPALQMNLSSFT